MLEATGLQVRVSRRVLVEELDCRVDAGAITVVLGPNGSGKTTLLRTLAGETPHHAGRILMHGEPLESMTGTQLAACRAVLSQQLDLDFPFTVAEIVAMGCAPHARSSDAGTLQAALQRHALSNAAARLYPSLSGGEQRRVHLARIDAQASPALDSGQPFVLMLDEPATHLDPAHQLELAMWMRAMADRGAAILAILHDFQLAASLADRVILLNGCGGVQEGEASDLMQPDVLEPVFGIPVGIAHGENGESVLYTGTPGSGRA